MVVCVVAVGGLVLCFLFCSVGLGGDPGQKVGKVGQDICQNNFPM